MYRDYVNRSLKYQTKLRDRKLSVTGLDVLCIQPNAGGLNKINSDPYTEYYLEDTEFLKVHTNFTDNFNDIRQGYISDENFNFQIILPVNKDIKTNSRFILFYPNRDNTLDNYSFWQMYSQESKKLDIIYSKVGNCQLWRFIQYNEELKWWCKYFKITDSIESFTDLIEYVKTHINSTDIIEYLLKVLYYIENTVFKDSRLEVKHKEDDKTDEGQDVVIVDDAVDLVFD